MLSMIGMGFGGVLNCFLDPLFIFGFGLGVTGASMATAISKLVSFGILIFPYLTKRSLLRISFSRFRPTKEILYQIVSVGSASMFRSALGVVSGIALNNIAGSISDSVLAGIGVSTKIMMFPFSFILGFGAGFQPVAGFNWGAKRYDRVRQAFWFCVKVAFIALAIIAAGLCVAAEPLLRLFRADDPQVIEIGALALRLQAVVLPLQAWVTMCNMAYQTIGDGLRASVLALARKLGIQTVVEGVETPENEELVRSLACDYGQGYYYSKPIPAEQFRQCFCTMQV